MTSSAIISKVWSFCNTLRDDGVGEGFKILNPYIDVQVFSMFIRYQFMDCFPFCPDTIMQPCTVGCSKF